MAKKRRCRSGMITEFISHAARGRIMPEPNSDAKESLWQMVDALHKILDGDNPDDALDIERTVGQSPNTLKNFLIAHKIQTLKEKGENWEVITRLVNELLSKEGYQALSQSRLKNLYEEQRPGMEKALQPVVELTGLVRKR